MALEHLNEISEEERLFHEALTREMTERDHLKRLTDAREEGIAEGIAEGREEGIAKGIAADKKNTALNMLKEGFELPMISKITGLSETDIKRITTDQG